MILALALLFFCLALPRRVHAYIDPGTGNYLLQIIMAALFGALFAIKIFWTKIKNALSSIHSLLLKQKQDRAKQ